MNYEIFKNDFELVNEFQSVYSSEFVHRYWSGPCTIYMIRFAPILLALKPIDAMYDELFRHVKCLFTNRLCGKTIERS